MKKLVIISFLQLICGVAFSQEPVKAPPAPKEEIMYPVLDEPAEFPGGMSALKEYLKTNVKYPESAKEKEIAGKCYVQFIVNELGDVANAQVKKGVIDCPECDKEAVRIVNTMPRWTPGKIKGKPVKSTFTLPIIFKPE
ncbi:energy transducer TonB [Fluviicola sp.]|uniref:energy transducer TonB n=1 Tax=Fluviicola sp. TaxID=1917219 RepID=UPI0031D86900